MNDAPVKCCNAMRKKAGGPFWKCNCLDCGIRKAFCRINVWRHYLYHKILHIIRELGRDQMRRDKQDLSSGFTNHQFQKSRNNLANGKRLRAEKVDGEIKPSTEAGWRRVWTSSEWSILPTECPNERWPLDLVRSEKEDLLIERCAWLRTWSSSCLRTPWIGHGFSPTRIPNRSKRLQSAPRYLFVSECSIT